nr:Os07g0674150 [Ipomoea batatas]GMC65621.1 Os07g0674150 [Ipomoea batatas]GME13512.1 Os07g0674150 [Ipomoea batatas]
MIADGSYQWSSSPWDSQPGSEIVLHQRNTFAQFHLRFPAKQLLRLCDVGLSLARIVRGVLHLNNFHFRIDHLLHSLGKFVHCEFTWIPDVNWPSILALHKPVIMIYHVRNIAETASLCSW